MHQSTKDIIMRFCIVILISVCIGGGCTYFNKFLDLKNDNIVEEAVEFYIEKNLGIDLDLTPASE